MKKTIIKDDYSQAINTFLEGDYDADQLIQKFDDLRSVMEDTSEHSLSKIKKLIDESELSSELTEQLLSTITDPKTRIFIHPFAEENHTESSSLLNELLKCNTNDENEKLHSGQIIRGNYRLISRIGKGGMGEVWKAVDLIQDAGDSRNKYVAIKFISYEIRSHPYALKALVREFARYKQLIHPNIVKAYELNRDENKVFIVMEYLEGLSLKEFIKQHPEGMSLAEAKPIISSICKALSYAHDEGIVHLDLKPANIFYNPETKKAKVIDFGIARLAEQSERDKTRFDPGTLGAISTAYASVDMLLLDNTPDPRDDIYSLACVVYETLSGKHAFDGAIATKAERNKMHPKFVKGLKNTEFRALLNGLNFIRTERTTSTEQFFHDLYLPKMTARQKRSRWLIISGILLLIATVTPFQVNKVYNQWKNNKIIESIAQNEQLGIDKFQALSVKKQLELLVDEETLVSLINFSIDQATTQMDPIKLIHGFNRDVKNQLYKNHDARKILIEYYIESINKALNNDDFDLAIAYSISITNKFPDSKNLANQMEKVLSWKIERVTKLENNYHQCISDNSKSLFEIQHCLKTTFESISKLAPQHKILADPRLSERYQKEITITLKNVELAQTEELLANWYSLVNTEIPQRKELKHELNHKKHVLQTSKQIINSNDDQMKEVIYSLLELDTRTKTDILNKLEINKKVMTYFDKKITNDINRQEYTAVFKHIELASTLFKDVKKHKSNLQILNRKVLKYKIRRLKELSKNYKETLSKKYFNLNEIKIIQAQIAIIDADNELVKFPGVSKVLALQTWQALDNKQFEVAFNYLESWKTIKLTKSQSKIFLVLNQKYQQQLSSHKKTMDIRKRIMEAMQNSQSASVNTLIEDMKNSFTALQTQEVINSLQTQLVIFYQKQIQSAMDDDTFSLADDTADTALYILPDEKSLLFSKEQIKKEKAFRIQQLLNNFQITLESETADGKQIFSSLRILQLIDNQHLEKNLKPYHALKSYLVSLSKNVQALEKLKDITTQWDVFLNAKKTKSQENKIYYETKNLIALHCLHTGRQLKDMHKLPPADEFLLFGLSLNPIVSVKKALQAELKKNNTPVTIIE